MFKVKPKSIGYHISVLLSCIALIPLILVGTLTYFYSSNILKNKLIETSSQTVSEINNGLSHYFTALSSLVSLATNDEALMNQNILSSSTASIDSLLERISESNTTISTVFFVSSNNDINLYPKKQVEANFNALERPWYTKAIANPEQVVFTDVYIDNITDAPIITASRTVLDKNNKVIGVLGVDFDLSSLATELSRSKVGNEGIIYLLDPSGLTISHPDETKLGSNFITQASFWKEIANTESGFIEVLVDNHKYFITFTTNPVTGWNLIGEMEDTELTDSINKIRQLTIIAIIVLIALIAIISTFIAKITTKSIIPLKDAFERISNGDLTARISEISPTKELNAISIYFNEMIEHIAYLINEVNHSSDKILETSIHFSDMAQDSATALNEVSASMVDIAEGVSNTTTHTLEGVENMGHLASKIDQITDQTTTMSEISLNTTHLSSKGLTTTKLLSEKSTHSKTAIMEIKNQIDDLKEFAKKITIISDTISQITEQTNLLALNASIEAARAGSSGAGFAIVADEIRKLAEASKVSTEEINHILLQIEAKSSQAALAMEGTAQIITEQDLAVTETIHTFDEIIESINVLTSNTQEIATYIKEINTNKVTIVNKIQEIYSISEESSSATEEVCATTENISNNMERIRTGSQELKVLSKNLKENIAKFKI